jgi:hypothetical protein
MGLVKSNFSAGVEKDDTGEVPLPCMRELIASYEREELPPKTIVLVPLAELDEDDDAEEEIDDDVKLRSKDGV